MISNSMGMVFVNNTGNRFNGISYLKHLKKNGIKLDRIIVINLLSKSRKLKKYRFPLIVNRLIATFVASVKFTILKKKLKKIHDEMINFLDYEDLYNFSKKNFYEYSREVCFMNVNGINDSKLIEALTVFPEEYFIFSGGGILRKRILQTKEFLHVHPGIVPEVKGADGLFWSMLLRNKVGMSCFFMDSGIDTGKVLFQKEYKYKTMNFLKEYLHRGYSYDDLYKSLLYFYDSNVRGIHLVETIKAFKDSNKFNFIKNNNVDSNQYYFMNKQIRNIIIDKMIGVVKDEVADF
jgi:Formyl transferase